MTAVLNLSRGSIFTFVSCWMIVCLIKFHFSETRNNRNQVNGVKNKIYFLCFKKSKEENITMWYQWLKNKQKTNITPFFSNFLQDKFEPSWSPCNLDFAALTAFAICKQDTNKLQICLHVPDTKYCWAW